ncbi:MAG TPA: hypothetical protein VMS08_03005 [Candidatus Saccharimonadia bacterium]|nr:hypothetical protein [Candidatus Saccharimonadia bacterium]
MSDVIEVEDEYSKKVVPTRDEFDALSEKVDAIKDIVLFLESISNPVVEANFVRRQDNTVRYTGMNQKVSDDVFKTAMRAWAKLNETQKQNSEPEYPRNHSRYPWQDYVEKHGEIVAEDADPTQADDGWNRYPDVLPPDPVDPFCFTMKDFYLCEGLSEEKRLVMEICQWIDWSFEKRWKGTQYLPVANIRNWRPLPALPKKG